MVKEIYKDLWICPYSDKQYIINCASKSMFKYKMIEEEKINYTCEYCNEEYSREWEALECEQDHIELKDKCWFNHEEKSKIEFWLEVGNHKEQKKLV